MSGLSVVIPSKTVTNLIPCVNAVLRHERTARIIVMDDGLVWPAEQQEPDNIDDLLFLLGSKPFIFARNVNLGIRAAGTDDVVLLNDDAILQTPGGFMAMQKVAEENPQYGIIGAVTNVTGQPLQQPKGIGLREVPHIAYVCVFIPRHTIDTIGLLDERYADYGCDDLDHCEAARRAGLKIGVFDFCFVDHQSLTSTFRGHPNTPRDYSHNYALYKQKWGIM
jgi:GT2 family glycosyltransferase